MNFPTAAGEVETHKFQLSIVYHLLLFSVGVRRLPRSRFLASVMLSKDSTRTELGKRPIPTRRVGHNLNTITYRRSLLSRQPNSYHRGYRKDKREDNLVSHSLLLFGYSGNNQVTSSPGWDRHRTTRPGPRCVPPFFLFHYPLMELNWNWVWSSKESDAHRPWQKKRALKFALKGFESFKACFELYRCLSPKKSFKSSFKNDFWAFFHDFCSTMFWVVAWVQELSSEFI